MNLKKEISLLITKELKSPIVTKNEDEFYDLILEKILKKYHFYIPNSFVEDFNEEARYLIKDLVKIKIYGHFNLKYYIKSLRL